MGNNQSRRTIPGTPAHYMFEHYGLEACKFLNKWHREIRFPKQGTFDMDQILNVRAILLTQKSRNSQSEWLAFFLWSDEAEKIQSESQAGSFKDLEAQLAKSKDAQEKQAAQLANTEAQLAKSKDAQEKQVAQLANTEAQLAKSKDAQEKQAAQLANTEAQLAKSKDAHEKLAAQLAESKVSQADLEDKLASSKEAQTQLGTMIAKSNLTQSELEAQLNDSMDDQEEMKAELANMEYWLAQSKNAERKQKAQLAQSKNAQGKLKAQLAQSKNTQGKLEAQLAQSRNAQGTLEAQLAQSKDAQGKLEAQLAQSRNAQGKLEAQLAQSKDAQKELEAQLDDLKAKCKASPRPETSGSVAPSTQTLQPPPVLWQQLLAGENSSVLPSATLTRSELLDLRKDLDIQKHPDKFREILDLIFRRSNPRWAKVNWLLGVLIPERSVRERLLAKAQWPTADPYSEVILPLAKQCLLGAVCGVCPKNVNWFKIRDCKQRDEETPEDFWERLKTSFEQYSGIPQATENAPDVMAYVFLQALHPEALEGLKKVRKDWPGKSVSELVSMAGFSDYFEKQEQQRWARGYDDPAFRLWCD